MLNFYAGSEDYCPEELLQSASVAGLEQVAATCSGREICQRFQDKIGQTSDTTTITIITFKQKNRPSTKQIH